MENIPHDFKIVFKFLPLMETQLTKKYEDGQEVRELLRITKEEAQKIKEKLGMNTI
jgi:hypothetical protein